MRIDISGASAVIRNQDILTVGMVGAKAEFRFSEEWNGLSKIAVFRQGGVSKDVIITSSVATIPWEVLRSSGLPVSIGVYGANSGGTVVIPTIWVDTRPLRAGADPSGDESADPTPSVWAEMLGKISDIESVAGEHAVNSAPPIVVKKSGVSITVSDSASRALQGLKIYGHTTQALTPTVESPVELKSACDGERISVHVCGKNLFSGWIEGGINPETGEELPGGSRRRTGYLPVFGKNIAISGIPSTLYNMAAFYDTDKVYISRTAANSSPKRVYSVPANAKYFRVSVYESSATTGTISEADATVSTTMIEVGDAATEYEAGKTVKSVTISSIDGLRGIAVSGGGNYTDENGQQWVCDEIDLSRGVYVQRCFKETVVPAYNTSNDRYNATLTHNANPSLSSESGIFVMCDKLPFNGKATSGVNGIRISTAVTNLAIAYYNGEELGELTLVYPLETPIETPLSAEELEAYCSLRTHKPVTTVCNDGFAHMELEYIADTKTYIDNHSPSGVAAVAKTANVVLLAKNWVTQSENLHSQVVAISGTTERSQVDLTPSKEQLLIFYEKDLTFGTENEDGVITVYVIGQKPLNDYTIAATITEVNV